MADRQRVVWMYKETFDSPSSENEITSTTFDEEMEAQCKEDPMDFLSPCNATVPQKRADEQAVANDPSLLSRSGIDTSRKKQTKSTTSGEVTNTLTRESKDFCTISSVYGEENQSDTILQGIGQNNTAYTDASLGTDSSNAEDFMSENGDDFDIFGAKLVSMLLSFTSRDGDRQNTNEVKDETELTSTCQQLTVLESRPKWSSCREENIDRREENQLFYNDSQPDVCKLVNRNNKLETLNTGTSKSSYVLPMSFNKLEIPRNSHFKRTDSLESIFISSHNSVNQIKCSQDVGSQPSFASVDETGNTADDIMMMRWDTANIVHLQEINKKEHQRLETMIVDSAVKSGYRFSKPDHGNESELSENGNSIGLVPSWIRNVKEDTIDDSRIHFETRLGKDSDEGCCNTDGATHRSGPSDSFPCSNHHRKNGIQPHRQNGCVQPSRSHKDKSTTRSTCCKYDEISDTFNRTSYPHITGYEYQCRNELDINSTKTALRYPLSNPNPTRLHQNESETKDSKNIKGIDFHTNLSIVENHAESSCSWQNSPKPKDAYLTYPTIVSSDIFSEKRITPRPQDPATSHIHPLEYLSPFPEPETAMSSSQRTRAYSKENNSSQYNEGSRDSSDGASSLKSRFRHKFTSDSSFASHHQIYKKSHDYSTSNQRKSRDAKPVVYNDEMFISSDTPFSKKSESISNNPFSPYTSYEQQIAKSRGITSEPRIPRDEFHDQPAITENIHSPTSSEIAMFSNCFRTSKVMINPSYNLDLDYNIHCRRIKSTSVIKPTATASLRKCGLPPCRVCGDRASGLHFGVNSCEACNEFFRRTLKKNSQYSCTKGGECDVIGRKRSSCSYCRFQKCLSLGMSRNAIKTGRYSHQKRTQYTMEIKRMERLKERREKERHMTDMTQDLLLKYKHFFASTSPDSLSSCEPCSGILGKTRHSRATPPVDDVMTEKYMKEEAKSTEDWIRRLIKFVKRVTIFEDVTLTDQAALIRMSWFEIRFLDSFRHFCSDTKIASDPIRRFITFDQLATLHSQDLASDIFRVADKLKRLSVRDDELVLMKCLYLTLSDRYVLADQVKVDALTEFITNSLLYTLERNRHGNAALLFPRIVDCFVELRSLAKTYFEGFSNFYVHHVTKNSQLLAEMIPVRENM